MTTTIAVSESLRLCMALFRAQAVLSRRFDGRLGSWHGMSFGDFIVLLHISRAEDTLGAGLWAGARALTPWSPVGEKGR